VQSALQSAQGLVDERAVFDDQQVRVEDAGIGRADRPGDFLLDIEKLLPRGNEGGLEAFDLTGDIRFLDVAKRDFLFILPMDDDLGLGNTGRNAQSLADRFLIQRFTHRWRCLQHGEGWGEDQRNKNRSIPGAAGKRGQCPVSPR